MGFRIVDAAAIVEFQNFLCGPGLVRRWFPPWKRGSARTAAAADSEFRAGGRAVGFLPGADAVAAALPYAGEVRLSVRRARNRRSLGKRKGCRERSDGD